MQVVLVDVDNTLVEGQSYTSVIEELLARGWRWPRLVIVLLMRLPHQLLRRLGLADRWRNMDLWARDMAWLLQGASADEVQEVLGAAARRMESRLRKPLLAELAEHKLAGRTIILASTSIEPVIAELAALVGAEGWVGTPLELEEGRFTGYLAGPPANGRQKLAYVDALMDRWDQRIDWAESYAYSDGLPDLPMLERVGRPVVVARETALVEIARERGWRIM